VQRIGCLFSSTKLEKKEQKKAKAERKEVVGLFTLARAYEGAT